METVMKECLSFRLAEEEYGIDILAVQEIRGFERPTRIANAPREVLGVVNLRGTIVPIVDLRLKLGFENASYDVFTVVIILNLEGGTTGVVVDAVSDVLRLRAEDVREAPDLGAGQLPIQGLATLEGRMVVLVDIARMLGGAVEAPGVALAA